MLHQCISETQAAPYKADAGGNIAMSGFMSSGFHVLARSCNMQVTGIS